ncbi:PD40 domain-containing protein [Desulfurispira natronophila]|uniref:Bacterial surface antigen (D15) domain-containing protein n=1 Tax=Desulfurispira natronophila TaxID=682562 RepID=A0A7W8DGC2_9BACT|nr:PD40 domain-containing protein [Desulfurispira natronophila]MBB5021209.1 hypothetical protein [Desulfurispira natronophila]
MKTLVECGALRRLLLSFFVFLLLGLATPHRSDAAITHNPGVTWQTLTTENFLVHFAPSMATLARQVAWQAEVVHQQQTAFFRWQPRQRTHLVLTDTSDQPNGLATFFPYNHITLYLATPDSIGGLEDFEDWYSMLLRHEYAHILHLDKARGFPKSLRNAFGRHFLLFPNMLQPLWVLEGAAIYQETDHEQQSGRGQNSYYDMLVRLEVQRGLRPLDQVNQPVSDWPLGVTPYLYGTHFFEFLRQTRGPEAMSDYIHDYSGQIFDIFRLQSASQRAFNARMTDLWLEFEHWLQERYTAQGDQIRRTGLRQGQSVTDFGYFTAGVAPLASGEILTTRRDGLGPGKLVAVTPSGGDYREIATVRSSRFDVHPQQGIVVAQTEVCQGRSLYFDLFHIDPQSGKSQRLTNCGRYRYGAWHPSGNELVAVQQSGQGSSLYRLNAQGEVLGKLWRSEEDVLAYPRWSPDGQWIVVSRWQKLQGWSVQRYRPDDGDWEILSDQGKVATQPRFSSDGNSLFYSADVGGVYNVYQLDLRSRETRQITNVTGGAFEPLLVEDTLYYIGYHPDGADLKAMVLPEDAGVVLPAGDGRELPNPTEYEPERPEIENARVDSVTPYQPWGSLLPRWWFPYVLFEEGQSQLGAVTSGVDALRRHHYEVSAYYDSENEWWGGDVSYRYHRWNPRLDIYGSREGDVRRNSESEVVAHRRQHTLQLDAVFPVVRYDWRTEFYLGYSYQLRNEVARPGGAALPDRQENSLGAALVYRSASYSARSMHPGQGRSLRLVLEDSEAAGSDAPGQTYTLDWQEYASLHRQRDLRLQFGILGAWIEGDAQPLRLGGTSGSTSSLLPGSPFLRRHYPLRGYPTGLEFLEGRRLTKAAVQLNFPLGSLQRSLVVPPVGLGRFSGSIFMEGASTWNDGSEIGDVYRSLGVEVHAESYWYYQLPARVTLGLAKGLDDGGDDMGYVQVGLGF